MNLSTVSKAVTALLAVTVMACEKSEFKAGSANEGDTNQQVPTTPPSPGPDSGNNDQNTGLTDNRPQPVSLACQNLGQVSEPTLLVFLDSQSELDRQFKESLLPQIEEASAKAKTKLVVQDVAGGIPKSVRYTPSVIYQNHLGRSQYLGDLSNLDNLRLFLLTAKRIPQKAVESAYSGFALGVGRSLTLGHTKITEIEGSKPAGYSYDAFVNEAEGYLANGLRQFENFENITKLRGDREFYFDFYPFLSEDNKLFVTVAVFSQFDCKTPIYISSDMDKPSGTWETRQAVFAEAAAIAESVVLNEINSSYTLGFTPVPIDIGDLCFEGLGLDLPPAPAQPDIPLGPLPESWQLVSDTNLGGIQFTLPPDFPARSGSASGVSGTLTFAKGKLTDTMNMEVAVETSKVTLGDEGLDAYVHSADVLNIQMFPDSKFQLTSLIQDIGEVEYGVPYPITVDGTFTMIGISTPVTAKGQMIATADETGAPLLIMNLDFAIDVKDPFGIDPGLGGRPIVNFQTSLNWNAL
ncbi:MAG: YceI family protein [Pseudobacteriovorax sp.]|nr:YceI family protein [Pseudobacteriovorax sp.]